MFAVKDRRGWVDVVICCVTTLVAQRTRGGVQALELSIDADMVQNIQSANETAARFSSTDYVDLTCKVVLSTTAQYSLHASRTFNRNHTANLRVHVLVRVVISASIRVVPLNQSVRY